MISVLNQLSRQGQAVSGRASRFEAPVSSFRTIGASQPVSSPTSPHQDKAATPARQPSILSQISRGMGAPSDMAEVGGSGPSPGPSLSGPQNAYEAHVARDLTGTVSNLGMSGLTKGLISGVGASYLGAPSSVAADYGFSNIAPGPMAALRAIADSARIGYADKRTRDAFQGLAFSPPDQFAEYQAAVKTGYDNPEAFSQEQELQNELTNRAMAAYNENKSWGNTLSALGRDVWGGVLSLLSGKPFKYEPVPPGFVAPMDILSRGEDAMDPNQSIGSLSPNDRMDPFSGPATPENPERDLGGWGWGDVGLGGSGLGGDSGGGISSAGDYGGDRGMGRDDGGGGYR